jgi:hypothetical protein
MLSNGLFSLGLILPLLLLFLGHVVVGLLFSAVAIAVRIRADSSLTAGKSQRKIDLAIAVLAYSELSSILGASLLHKYLGAGEMLLASGLFLLWPVSAFLTIWGRGEGRNVLLVGHGLIALWVALFFLSIFIYDHSSTLQLH